MSKFPREVQLEENENYLWCTCGLSQKQPFCDGSHKNTQYKPLKFVAKETRKVWLCCCKETNNPPFCDSSHNDL